jgi:beta-xylosidase
VSGPKAADGAAEPGQPRRGLGRRELVLGAAALGAAPLAQAWPWGGMPAQALTPVRAVVWRDFLGINAQFQWFPIEVARKQVERLKALGLSWVRLGLHWMLMEPQEGQFKLEAIDQMMAMVKDAGLRNITYVVGTPRFASSVARGDKYEQYFDKFPPKDPVVYAQRMVMLAKRYPQVDVWQVWNEPNILAFWAPKADPEGYGRLLLPTVQALRATVPNKPIAMAGMAYFSEMGSQGLMIEAMGKLGAFNLNLTIAYHPYTARAEGSEGDPRDFVKRVQPAHQWLRASGVKQIWATEWGWSSYKGPVEEQPLVGEDGQADLTLRRLALMAALDYDRVFLFTLSDLDKRASERDQHYGLLRENGEPKPLYHALQRFLQACGPRLEPGSAPAFNGEAPEGLVSIAWRQPDGRKLWMVWADKPGTVTLKGVRSAEVLVPATGQRSTLSDTGGGLRLAIGTRLQIVGHA